MSVPALVCSPRTPADLLLRDVHVLDPALGLDARHDLRIQNGLIAELGAPGTLPHDAAAELVDGDGRLYLLPAFCDPHVHLRTPGQEHKEDVESGTRAAAAGGFGALIAMPNTAPPLDSPQLLADVRRVASQQAHVPVGFLAAVSRRLAGAELTDMPALRDAGALGFTDDGLPVASAAMLRTALTQQRICGGVVALHEEDRSLSGEGCLREGPVSAALGLPGIPATSESTMVARDAVLAASERGRVHFQHLSCVASVRALAAAKAHGAPVSGEVTPHHLLLTEECVRGLDTSMKMNPPLASEADREALVQGLRDGTIDCVATDHAPHAPAEKALPFPEAPMGTIGLETAFAALYTELVLPGVLALTLLVERLTAGAALFELPPARIARGQSANLTLVDLEAEWTAGEHPWQSRSRNSCFTGRRLRGRVLMTCAAGAVAYRADTHAAVLA